MKSIILVASLAVGAWILTPTLQGQDWSLSPSIAKAQPGLAKKGGTPPGLTRGVPELDPSAAGAAMILLLGGAAYIMSRRREEYHA